VEPDLIVDKLKLGMYAQDLMLVIGKVRDASLAARQAKELLDGGVYQGGASDEMQMYYTNYARRIDQLAYFDLVAHDFLWQVIDGFGKADQDLFDVINKLAGL